MTNILHVIHSLSRGGAARSMIAVSKYSARYADYRHRVISLGAAEPEAVQLARQAGIQVVVAPGEAEIEAELRRADVVQVQYWNTPEVNRFLRQYLTVPSRLMIWYHIAGNGSPQIITPELVATPDVNIPCNPFTYHDLPVFRDMPAVDRQERVAMVYDAADFDRVRDVKPKSHSEFNVGYIGTVDFFKMHPNFVQMSASVDIPDVRFVVCGQGIEKELERRVAAMGASDRFAFRGYVDDIASVIAELDVYGYPLCEDTYAAAELNLQEVMYAGVPPVVFPYGGVGRLVQHGETGLIVNSEQEYTEAIEYLYHHPAERERLGRNAAAYARTHFGAENAARAINDVYSTLMQRPKRAHAWGRRPDSSTPISAFGAASQPTAAELFVDSLGPYGADFALSQTADNSDDAVRADARIASSSYLLLRSGLNAYHRHDQKDPHLLLWIGLCCETKNDLTTAATAFTEAARHGTNFLRADAYLVRVLEGLGRTEEARKLRDRLTKQVPQQARLLRQIFAFDEISRDDGQGAGAPRRISGNDAENHVKIRIIDLLEQGRLDEAAPLVLQYKKTNEDDVDAGTLSATLLILRNDFESAEAELKAVLNLAPDSIEARLMLAEVYVKQGLGAEAVDEYKRAQPYAPPAYKPAIKTALQNLMQGAGSSPGTKKKLAVLVRAGLDQFLNDLIENLRPDYEVRKVVVHTLEQVEQTMQWADVCWFEWCDQLIVHASQLEIAKHKKLICRLHRYEAFTEFPGKVRWERVDRLVLVADHIREILRSVVPGIESRVRIDVVHNGVDLDRHQFEERAPGHRLAYVGYLHARKNPTLLLQVMAKLVEIDPRYQLFVAGRFQDPMLQLYWNYHLKAAGLTAHVHFEGWQDDVASWLSDKNYFLSSSIHESFGYAIAEAMAMGIKPVVHNFLFAHDVWPQEILFNNADEAAAMVTSTDYQSKLYRNFIETRYSLEGQAAGMRQILTDVQDEQAVGEQPHLVHRIGSAA